MDRQSAAWGATLLRVGVGVVYVMHGYYAVAVLRPRAVASLITGMGYPSGLSEALSWYLIVAHVVGGILLILGLWTTWSALAQVPIMASAVFLLHWPQGFFMRGILVEAGRAIAGGFEYALFVLLATLAVAMLGPGALAVDGRQRPRRHVRP